MRSCMHALNSSSSRLRPPSYYTTSLLSIASLPLHTGYAIMPLGKRLTSAMR